MDSSDQIIIRKGADRTARRIAMYLAVMHCKKLYSLAQISSFFGVGINAISSNIQKLKAEIGTSKILREKVKQIETFILHKHEN